MKRNSYLVLVLFFAGVTIFSSCKKDEEKPAKPKTELLSGTTSKTWKQTNEETAYMGSTVSTFKMFRPDECNQDDITIFFTDKKLEEREGVKKCSTQDLLDTGKWSLSSDEKELTMDYDGEKQVWKIKEINDKILKLEKTDPDMPGASFIDTYTAL